MSVEIAGSNQRPPPSSTCQYIFYVEPRKCGLWIKSVDTRKAWYSDGMNDINIQITRAAYDRFSITAAKRRKKLKKRVSIKSVVEEASKLVRV